MAGTEHFDQAEATWDLAERRVALAHGVAQAIRARVAPAPALAVLDFGCGTGLVTLAMAAWVGSITGADSSPEMLRTLGEKAVALGIKVAPLALDTAGTTPLGGPYDLIVSSMTLHHIADVPALLARFHDHLLPGGQVALADLDAEDGSFHDSADGVHHQGFDRNELAGWLAGAGFTAIHLDTATVTAKGDKEFSVFLATAAKAPTPPPA